MYVISYVFAMMSYLYYLFQCKFAMSFTCVIKYFLFAMLSYML